MSQCYDFERMWMWKCTVVRVLVTWLALSFNAGRFTSAFCFFCRKMVGRVCMLEGIAHRFLRFTFNFRPHLHSSHDCGFILIFVVAYIFFSSIHHLSMSITMDGYRWCYEPLNADSSHFFIENKIKIKPQPIKPNNARDKKSISYVAIIFGQYHDSWHQLKCAFMSINCKFQRKTTD